MKWHISYRADAAAVPIADRHYNRQHIGSPQFVPPGACVVLRTAASTALWVTSWPLAQYVRHAWAGAWVNSCFRNERPDLHLSSKLILEGIAATRFIWPDIPALGMITFIDTSKVRRKRDFGRCYRKAGFKPCGWTKSGLLALQLKPEDMPDALAPIGCQLELSV